MEAAMLDRAHRLRRRDEFAAAIRRGRRAGRGTLVVHLLRPGRPGHRTAPHPPGSRQPAEPGPGVPPRAGFIVPRTVGGAVIRNTVRRRLRHLVLPHLARLPAGSLLVVRVLPAAASAGAATLGADLTAALQAATRTSPAPAASTVRTTPPPRVDAG